MSQLETISEEFNSKTLMGEIQKTNEFVGMCNMCQSLSCGKR